MATMPSHTLGPNFSIGDYTTEWILVPMGVSRHVSGFLTRDGEN